MIAGDPRPQQIYRGQAQHGCNGGGECVDPVEVGKPYLTIRLICWTHGEAAGTSQGQTPHDPVQAFMHYGAGQQH